MTLHIGIVGCSAERAALCYRTICSEGAALLGPHGHPEISMHTLSLAKYVHCLATWLVRSEVYPRELKRLDIECIRPGPEDREEVGRIIMDELVPGRVLPASVARCEQVVHRLKDDGCDAVVLGCTELPLIMGDANSPIPTLDSTRLLGRAALSLAASNLAHPSRQE